MTEKVTAAKLKKFGRNAGADTVGIAAPEIILEIDEREDASLFLRNPKSVVIALVADPPHTSRARDGLEYSSLAYPGYQKADGAVTAMRGFLHENGYRTRYIVREWLFDRNTAGRQSRVLSLKKAAQAAGLGTIGRHTLLINPKYGSGVRLSGFITDAPLSPDRPLADPVCDGCGLCAEKCPSGAIGKNGEFDFWACSFYLFSGISLKEFNNLFGDGGGGAVDMLRDNSKKLRQAARGWIESRKAGRSYYYTCGNCVRACTANKRYGKKNKKS